LDKIRENLPTKSIYLSGSGYPVGFPETILNREKEVAFLCCLLFSMNVTDGVFSGLFYCAGMGLPYVLDTGLFYPVLLEIDPIPCPLPRWECFQRIRLHGILFHLFDEAFGRRLGFAVALFQRLFSSDCWGSPIDKGSKG